MTYLKALWQRIKAFFVRGADRAETEAEELEREAKGDAAKLAASIKKRRKVGGE